METPEGHHPDTRAFARHRYAGILRVGVRVALVLLLAAFVVYTAGVLPAHVPLNELPKHWTVSAKEYVDRTGMPTDWQWVGRLGEGDVASIVPAIFLALLTAVCLVAVLPAFLRRREYAYAVMVILQLGIFAAAALPGLFTAH